MTAQGSGNARINGLVTGGGLFLQQILGFVSGLYVAMLLGPANYGEVSVLRSLLQLVIVVSPLGLDLAIYKILPAFDATPRLKLLHVTRFRIIIFASCMLMAIGGSTIIGPILQNYVYSYKNFELHFALTVLAVPFATDLVLLTSYCRVEGRIVPIMLLTYYLQPILRTSFSIIAVLLGWGVLGVVIGTACAYLASFLAAQIYRALDERHHAPAAAEPAPLPGWRESWRLFLQAPSMALNLFAYNVMRSADLVIVAAMVPAQAVGEYAVVSNISQLVPVAAISLSQTLGPTISRHFHAGETHKIAGDMNHYIRWASIISSFVMGGIATFGGHLDVLFGPKYHPEAAILVLIPLGYLVSATLAPTGYSLTMCGKARQELAILATSSAGLVFLCLVLTHFFGTVGAASAVLIAFVGGDVARLLAVNRSLGVALGHWSDLLPPVVAIALGAICNNMLVPAHPSFIGLVLGCFAYLTAYVLVFGIAFMARRRWPRSSEVVPAQ